MLLFPLRMLRRECLYPVNGEGELKINWLLSPERAVVIEGGDAFLRWNEIRRALFRYLFYELNNRFLGCGIVP